MNLNKVMIIGNLTRDPEVKTIPSGQSVATFGVATNRVWNDPQTGQKQERVEFHNVVMWRRLAEICGQYLRKGSKVYIEGRLQTRDWVGQDGVKRYTTEIIGENMIMLDRAGAGNTAPATQAPAPSVDESFTPPPQENSAPQVSTDNINPEDTNPSEEEIKVENIPF